MLILTEKTEHLIKRTISNKIHDCKGVKMNKEMIKNLSNKNGKKYLIKANCGSHYYIFKLDKTKLNAFINEYIASYDITILRSY